MNTIEIALTLCTVYRIKYPGHTIHQVPSSGKFDFALTVLIIIQTSTRTSLLNYNSMYIAFCAILPHYPWFLVLTLIPVNGMWNLIKLIAIYGLEQPPWNKSWLYAMQKYIIFLVVFLDILS